MMDKLLEKLKKENPFFTMNVFERPLNQLQEGEVEYGDKED